MGIYCENGEYVLRLLPLHNKLSYNIIERGIVDKLAECSYSLCHKNEIENNIKAKFYVSPRMEYKLHNGCVVEYKHKKHRELLKTMTPDEILLIYKSDVIENNINDYDFVYTDFSYSTHIEKFNKPVEINL